MDFIIIIIIIIIPSRFYWTFRVYGVHIQWHSDTRLSFMCHNSGSVEWLLCTPYLQKAIVHIFIEFSTDSFLLLRFHCNQNSHRKLCC